MIRIPAAIGATWTAVMRRVIDAFFSPMRGRPLVQSTWFARGVKVTGLRRIPRAVIGSWLATRLKSAPEIALPETSSSVTTLSRLPCSVTRNAPSDHLSGGTLATTLAGNGMATSEANADLPAPDGPTSSSTVRALSSAGMTPNSVAAWNSATAVALVSSCPARLSRAFS